MTNYDTLSYYYYEYERCDFMNYCRHDIVLYFGKERKFTEYSICYDRKYVCAYCGSKNIFNRGRLKKVINLDYKNINLNDNNLVYEEFNRINKRINAICNEENMKNNVKTLVLKR